MPRSAPPSSTTSQFWHSEPQWDRCCYSSTPIFGGKTPAQNHSQRRWCGRFRSYQTCWYVCPPST
eukprot:4312967-Pyramimonas_sp.AAC.1